MFAFGLTKRKSGLRLVGGAGIVAQMTTRPRWHERLLGLLARRSVLWLSGVRRAGKTTLCRALPNAAYFDCELPRVRQDLADPELFFSRQGPCTVILDEVHRLADPSECLKIAADHFPQLRVVATGSSTLAARQKFRDTLTGRKHELWLTPMTAADAAAFGDLDLDRRMLRGGLPPFFLSDRVDDLDYREWLDSYWAKDLQELFVVEKRTAFLKFVQLLMLQSGDLYEASRLATPCEISRQTAQNYLSILETTLLVTVLRPFSGNHARELRAQPKVYAFDTGFVCFARGWATLNDEARGRLFEHLVLNELLSELPKESVNFWRDKQRMEVDFVVTGHRGRGPLAIECKLNPEKFNPAALNSFRGLHPEGENWLVARDLVAPTVRRLGGHEVRLIPYAALAEAVRGWMEG